jgi:phosphohistidine swiveling domain-containing protein
MANQATDFPLSPDLEGFFIWDRLHCPRPLAPLEHQLLVVSTGIGFSQAIGEMGSSIIAECHLINYYNYLTGVPRPLDNGETEEQRNARYVKNVAELKPKLGEKWENEWLPSMMPQLEKARNVDYSGYSDDDLMRRFKEMHQEVIYRWYIHGLLLYSFAAANDFADFFEQHVSTSMEGYEALQGFETQATKSSRGLWNLSRSVRNNPELRDLFERLTPDELPAELEKSEAGRAFMEDLRTYLKDYGWRADSVYELTQPAWWENPSIPLGAIQGFVSIDDEHGPESQLEAAIKRREELLAQARSKLANDPEKLKQFNDLYDAAQSFTPIVEDHNHWIDQMGDITMRYPALEIGKRLADKGLLEKPNDVFMLFVEEVDEAMAGKDFKSLVAERRAEQQRFAKVVPPPVIGTPPPPSDDPVMDVLNRFFGQPVEPSSDASVLAGIAAAPGVATGVAKVVRSLDEASKLQQGDIMVCEMTLPPWTPLFSTVSAVVADTGGILSHCAIVAREYRIPCVVGTAVGTVTIKDGQTVTVDGSKGIVRIES